MIIQISYGSIFQSLNLFIVFFLSSGNFFFQKVQHELLSVYANQLLEKEHSGCHALLRDDKVLFKLFLLVMLTSFLICLCSNVVFSCFPLNAQVEDLSRMFRLFSKIPRGLDPVSSIFKQVVTLNLSLCFSCLLCKSVKIGVFLFSFHSCWFAYKILSLLP